MEVQRSSESKLGVGFVINTVYAVALLIFGIFVGSLVIVSNGEHSIADSFSFVVSYMGARVSKREANPKHTYGYGMTIYIAAFTNATILIAFATVVFYLGYLRIMNPVPTSGTAIIIASIVGVGVSSLVAMLLNRGKTDLNIKSVSLHMIMDAMALAGSIVAGALILLTGNYIFDPLISFLIGFVMVFAAYGIIRDSIHTLMEGVPPWIDLEAVRKEISGKPNVGGIHDLHIWLLSSRETALSCHITMKNCSLEDCTKFVTNLKDDLKKKFGISHATIESELESLHAFHGGVNETNGHE